MSTFELTRDEPFDQAPIPQWIEELGQRLDGWSQSVKTISTEEWSKLRTSVAGNPAKRRVESVLRDVLSRIGVTAKDSEVDAMVDALRARILTYRQGQTIESYAEYFVEPPSIQV